MESIEMNYTGKEISRQRTFSTVKKNQQSRIKRALREVGTQGLTTIDLRESLDIFQPAARIWELRHVFGLNIQLVWVVDANAQGHEHKVGKYILQPGNWQEEP
jgi:hypothetical protein